MHDYIQREAEVRLAKAVARAPVTAILGPRQCGKSTLARRFLKWRGLDAVFLDLQDRVDRNKLNEPELFLEQHRDHLVCLDEIQRVPEFFSVLRSEIDRDRRAGRFLILGSASRDLIRQSGETLAGRIEYMDLNPFVYSEVAPIVSLEDCWMRGGFPDSLLAQDEESSRQWRIDFVRGYLERDIPGLGLTIPAPVMERLWRLLAHYHSETMNYSKLAETADISVPTLKKYIAILEQTYMVRVLPPFESNLKKRMVKAPKVYIRDSGILHTLLDIDSYDDLLSHPSLGDSWEGFVVDNIIAHMPGWRASFVRTSNGAEIDLILQKGNSLQAYECKASRAPRVSRGFFEMLSCLKPDKACIIAPVKDSYEYSDGVMVQSLSEWTALQVKNTP